VVKILAVMLLPWAFSALVILFPLAISAGTIKKSTLSSSHRSYRRQAFPNEFNPAPDSGLDDPTIQIADPSFATAINVDYQGPMASYANHALVGPVDLLRNGHVNYGVTPNFTLPLYYGVSASNISYWWIVTDTSDEGNAKQLGINFSSKLRYAAQGKKGGPMGAEQLNIVDNTVYGRVGLVDFYPVRNIVPGEQLSVSTKIRPTWQRW